MKKVVIIADRFLFFGYFVSNGIFFAFCAFLHLIQYFIERPVFATEKDRIMTLLLFDSLFLFLLVTEAVITPRWCRWFTFKKTEIECNTLFRKKEVIPYDNCYISYASYFHGTPSGLGSMRYYIVFSSRKLSRYEQDNINQASPKGIYKISYSKKTINKLESVLPAKLFSQVEVISKIIERQRH